MPQLWTGSVKLSKLESESACALFSVHKAHKEFVYFPEGINTYAYIHTEYRKISK